ncbi:MAG: nucleoside deaminase [Tissierellia bacterium]|jgi:tRNA(adenine34) deaminase|nr:tRNA adenosine(34) deaminase TadA [Bacillota bacterium]NLL23056.1 nucleoside deaminase [Tissierellia bacterium]
MSERDKFFMKAAIREAERAFQEDEVPIGAVAVFDGKIIASNHNRKEQLRDPLAHAEMLVVSETSKKLERWRLTGVTLYVTIEPCLMCMGALIHSRIDRLVFGARDPKFGGAKSLYELGEDPRMNHRFEVAEGVMAEEAAQLMRSFFASKR